MLCVYAGMLRNASYVCILCVSMVRFVCMFSMRVLYARYGCRVTYVCTYVCLYVCMEKVYVCMYLGYEWLCKYVLFCIFEVYACMYLYDVKRVRYVMY